MSNRGNQNVRAAVYTRLSKADDGSLVNVAMQEADCRRIAKARGWTVADVFVDNNLSAWKRHVRRPGWQALLDGLRERRYDAVVVYHGDRLIRQPRDLEELLDIADQGVQIASPSGDRNLASPDDRFILRIEVAQACKSSDDTSRRATRKNVWLAENGRPPGGPVGYGYRTKNEVDPAEAAIVVEVAARVLAGESLRGIVADLNRRGVPSKTGKQWTTQNLRNVLLSGRVAGMRVHRGRIVGPGSWPAILDAATAEQVRAVLTDPARRTKKPGYRYLLTGLLVCGRCGHGMCGKKSKGVATYGCVPPYGCNGMTTYAVPVEGEVCERLFARLDGHDLTAADGGGDGDAELLAEVGRLEGRLGELADMWAAGELDRVSWQRARVRVQQQLDDARGRLARLSVRRKRSEWGGRGGELRAVWPGLSLDQQRAVLSAVVERVTLRPAVRGRNVFDPDRVQVQWAM